MIINWIALHNFMSYADARLDLTSVQLACLSGDNGAGKSALLDAVSWAFWEEARAASDELIRLGQTEMWVDICVTVDNRVYRVRRSRQKTFGKQGHKASSKGTLELQVFSGQGEVWRTFEGNGKPRPDDAAIWTSLSASSMKETQERIRQLLHMDYSGFSTSVYLRQDRADEFTLRSASERKQVLADILGLDYFDRLSELAKDEARTLKARVGLLEPADDRESKSEQAFAQATLELEQKRAEIAQLVAEAEETLRQSNRIATELDTAQRGEVMRKSLLKRKQELINDLPGITRQQAELERKLQLARQIISQADQINESLTAYEKLKGELEVLELQSMQFHELQVRKLELRSNLATERGRLEMEAEHTGEMLQQLTQRKSKISKAAGEREKAEKEWTEYRQLLNRETELLKSKETFSTLSVRQEELQSQLKEGRIRLESEIQQKTALVEELDALDRARQEIDAEQLELVKLSEQMDRLENQFDLVEERGLKAKSEMDSIELQINQIKRHLKENHDRSKELESASDLSRCPLCRSPIVDRKAVLERYVQDAAVLNREIADMEERKAGLEAARSGLRKEYVELRGKLEGRKNLDIRIGEFNEKQAALARSQSTRESLLKEIEDAKKKLSGNSYSIIERESLVRIRAELAELDFDPVILANLQAQIRASRHVEFRWQQLSRDIAELKELDSQIPQAETRIAAIEENLKQSSFAPELRTALEKIEAELTACTYDRQEHQNCKEQLAGLIDAPQKKRILDRASEEEPVLAACLTELDLSASSKKQELDQIDRELADLEGMSAGVAELELERKEVHDRNIESNRRLRECEKALAALEARLEQLAEGQDSLEKRREALKETLKELAEYNQLIEILGKKGIQAVIIENVIPEIEAEANQILSRLSENQMHVALVTQQRTRQGAPIETLDIVIADEMGTRSYELYSGGEAFKINFALRLALARLLARRAGARLETLIIDEGFGSQDRGSRARLLNAIDSIREDFARIIVITHIAEVQEMFPVQIAVTKDYGISHLEILHQ